MNTYRLVVVEVGQASRVVEVAGALDVGREVEGLLLADAGVSRRHARFSIGEAGLVVEDTGSTNGTEVNGQRISGPVLLAAGDVVGLGDARLTVEVESAVAPGATTTMAPALPEAPAVVPDPAGVAVPPAAPPAPPPAPPVAPPAMPPSAPSAPSHGAPAAPAPAAVAPESPPPPPPSASAGPAPHGSPPAAAPPSSARRPILDELESRAADVADIRFRPGTAGAQAAGAVAQSAKRARRRLAGLGSEPWGVVPTICLVDPFPDPENPTELITSGVIVDAARGEIWMVITPESPPEPLERPLALVFGAGLPASGDLGPLLEAYGLHVANAPDPDPQLREMDFPPLAATEGEVAAAAWLSFVRSLIERGGTEAFVRFLGQAQPGRVDQAAVAAFGSGMAALEESWRRKLVAGPPDVKAGQFLRLTVQYLRPFARKEAEMFVYMLFGLAFTMVFPFAFKRLLDTAIPSGRFTETLTLLGVLSVAFVISMLADLRRSYLSAVVSGSVVRQLRFEMFAKMQRVSQNWYTHHEQGDVLSRLFTDVGELEQGLSHTLRDGVFQILSLIVSAVILVTLDPLLAVIVLAAAPLIALVYKGMARGAQKRSIAVQEETGNVLAVATENYSAQNVVKAFALQAREVGRFRQASDRLFDRQVKLQVFGGLFGLSVNMIVTGLRVFILGLGAWLILNGNLTVGGLVAFVGLMGEVLAPVTVLTGIGQQVQSATGALIRINEVLDAPPEVAEGDAVVALAPLAQEIRLDGVGFSYNAERKVLDDISVVIRAGEKVAFVGPTGAGKSSVLQLLMRFYDPDEGSITFDGVDVRAATLDSLRAQLGIVFQESFLFNATIRENISFGNPGATDAQIEDAARAAEMHDFVMALPRGYDTLVGDRGGRLSGGQRQRLAIARALLRDPRVLVLDEATSALDPRTERLISDTLDRVSQGRTTVAVTHRLGSITGYDRIFVIVAGQLAEQGSHDELLARGGVYAELWAEQTGGTVASEAPFDAIGALARVPLFSRCGPEELADAAALLRPAELRSGESMAEGGGRLSLLRRGRAQVLLPDLTGELAAVAELGAGDAFGLAALLGDDRGSVLRAVGPVSLSVLDDEAISGLAARHPTVADVLEGREQPAEPAPAGGQRLTRLTLAAPVAAVVPPVPPRPPLAPSPDELRRATGTMPAVRQ